MEMLTLTRRSQKCLGDLPAQGRRTAGAACSGQFSPRAHVVSLLFVSPEGWAGQAEAAAS